MQIVKMPERDDSMITLEFEHEGALFRYTFAAKNEVAGSKRFEQAIKEWFRFRKTLGLG